MTTSSKNSYRCVTFPTITLYDLRNTFPVRLSAARASSGLSGRDVAESAGIHWSTVYRYENGVLDNPRYMTIFRLAKALDVSSYWLMGSSAKPCSDPERNEFIQRYIERESEIVKPVSR